MNKYIDAEKLISEIDKKWKELADKNVKVGGGKYDIEISAYLSIKNLITSLHQEQPEVDLDDVIENYILENFGERWDGCVPVSCFELNMMANHFYELGLKAKKGE